ncbi:protein TOXD [Staphylotrichum tortipilum]|uniref:Protein TOXD n=1 Tax=Staphylotrichum tortipilum TaxID=2831512 RepID=A0AAN6MPF1_9PEZI|nr:protein TOXD [Staphylotrichum longicolle]
MASSPRNVIYLTPSGPLLKSISNPYAPVDAQSLLLVSYSGINPADIKHATLGLHSSVAGYDMSGVVLCTGPSSPFLPSDRIFGLNPAFPNRPLYMGAHQDYAIAAGRFWYELPGEGPLAADGLFSLLGLGFPDAGIVGEEKQGVVIWGGGSTVGVAAVQLAKAAGHGPVFVTASRKNHKKLKALGADYCFDYKDGDVVEQIREAIRGCGKPVRRALDAVGVGSFSEREEFGRSSPGMAAACLEQEGGVELACVLPVKADARYKLCFATRDPESPLPMARMEDPEKWYGMQEKVMAWVVKNYGEGKYVGCPNITVVKGAEECLEAMVRSAEGKSSLEKIAVEHSL